MRYVFTANCEFDADDNDDAFRKIRHHFQGLLGEVPETTVEFDGTIEILPKQETPPDLKVNVTETTRASDHFGG